MGYVRMKKDIPHFILHKRVYRCGAEASVQGTVMEKTKSQGSRAHKCGGFEKYGSIQAGIY